MTQMTLDEAITWATEAEKDGGYYEGAGFNYGQVAKWLKELKDKRKELIDAEGPE